MSTSLCGDTYLQAFTPKHIVALSWQSDSSLSRATKEQQALPQINASPETVFPHADNLIVFGPGEGSAIRSKLPHAMTLEWTEGFDGVYKNARALTDALSLSNKAVDDWFSRVQTLRDIPLKSTSPKILYLTPAGGSAGPNTFVDAVIKMAGAENINPVEGWHTPDIETLLSYKPDIVLQSFANNHYHSRGNIRPTVLTHHFNTVPVIDIDGKYWPCAGPGLLDATEILRNAIVKWHDRTQG